jgi:peptidoglycan/xylan/chitin deacetylase (PgdA/CDA1 family)
VGPPSPRRVSSDPRRGVPAVSDVDHSLVLGYHAVSQHWPSTLAISPARLREQLELLLRRGYRPATFSQTVLGDAQAKSLAVTFDDGFRSIFDLAFPLLAELGLPATVFVPTALVGGPLSWPGIERWEGTAHEHELQSMTWDQLRELSAAGWEVASHTRTHPKLTDLGADALLSELTESRETCEREMGKACPSLAYPYGAEDGRVRVAVRAAGYAAAGTLRPGPPDPLGFPRVGVYPIDDLWRFRIKVSPVVRRFRAVRLGQSLERWRTARRPS